MLLNWLVIHDGIMRLNRSREAARRQAFADPLERAEWRQRGWLDRLLCQLSRYR